MKGDTSPYVEVGWLATKQRGYGRQMMDQIAAYAAERGSGVYLGAVLAATGFYQKIGMKEALSGTGIFYWTAQETKERAGAKALDDLADLEPEDGVFTTGPLGPENEKGGPGSGNWGHTSTTRTGQVGGSDPGGGLAALGIGNRAPVEVRRELAAHHGRVRRALPEPVENAVILSLRALRSKAEWADKETARFIDSDGRFIGEETEGEPGKVTIPESAFMSMHTMVHIHPTAQSFSPADIAALVASNAQHSVVYAQDGTIYRLSKTPHTRSIQDVAPADMFTGAPFYAIPGTYNMAAAQGHTLAHTLGIRHEYLRNQLYHAPTTRNLEWKDITHEVVGTIAKEYGLSYARWQPDE
jgi:hypothetical protein